ncbi:TcpE family conjugal transfer membrane protein, partial [Clostridium saccharoperbutylacetonicum]|uniref:TcpE family conjugal transfer membrane protein n=1 Tax=Clostridium saccharoperbutylacetonicum TaxID=36745 RepID=UPI0039ED10BB
AMIIVFIQRIIPGISFIPPVLKYILFPYFVSKYLRQKKLDGKKPWKYLIDYVVFSFNKKNSYERFKRVDMPKEIKFDVLRFREG